MSRRGRRSPLEFDINSLDPKDRLIAEVAAELGFDSSAYRDQVVIGLMYEELDRRQAVPDRQEPARKQ
jgi:hypothetical protein